MLYKLFKKKHYLFQRSHRNNPSTQVVPEIRHRLKRQQSNGNGHGHDTERWIDNNIPGILQLMKTALIRAELTKLITKIYVRHDRYQNFKLNDHN